MNIYIAIWTSIQKAQGAPRGVWSVPIPGYDYLWTLAKLSDLIENIGAEGGDIKATRCQYILSLWGTATIGRLNQQRPDTGIQHNRDGSNSGQPSSLAIAPNLEAHTHLFSDF